LHFDRLIRLVKAAVQDHVPLMKPSSNSAPPDSRAARHESYSAGRWTAEQERAWLN